MTFCYKLFWENAILFSSPCFGWLIVMSFGLGFFLFVCLFCFLFLFLFFFRKNIWLKGGGEMDELGEEKKISKI